MAGGFVFGSKKNEVVDGDGVYLRSFKKGETKVRFLQEPGDWFAYREHFDPGQNVSFPCMQDNKDICPGCTSDNERIQNNPRRYATFVYLVDAERVLPFRIPQRLSERLEIRKSRNDGTLLNRDYIIIKSGSGLETDYDVDQDERYPLDIETLWKQRGDLEAEEIVAHAFESVFGDPELFLKDAAPKEKPVRGAHSPTSTSTDDVPDALKTKEEREAAINTPTNGMAVFAEEDVEVSEAGLKKMSRSELKAVWVKAGLPEKDWNDDWDRPEIVKEMLKRAK